jgi:predicted DNA-binding transcriptional regulator YafY
MKIEPYTVSILYTNHRDETKWRNINPIALRFISTEHHPEKQWLIYANDIGRNVHRHFALKRIKEWKFPWGGSSCTEDVCDSCGG